MMTLENYRSKERTRAPLKEKGSLRREAAKGRKEKGRRLPIEEGRGSDTGVASDHSLVPVGFQKATRHCLAPCQPFSWGDELELFRSTRTLLSPADARSAGEGTLDPYRSWFVVT
jgi:hypothetical protein